MNTDRSFVYRCEYRAVSLGLLFVLGPLPRQLAWADIGLPRWGVVNRHMGATVMRTQAICGYNRHMGTTDMRGNRYRGVINRRATRSGLFGMAKDL